ncbi:lasso peptide biosynthesis B2 protein [Nocardia sp. NPDC051570]|uniref:lasso peptide biosynthesis B2 protein n=1 Tax=Nocardia sp. NPDC051570 TaxID=3364324 RepID=UPI0037B5992C
MSTPETLLVARRPSLATRFAARLAVTVALVMARWLSPRRIRRTLAALSYGAAPATYRQAFDARSAIVATSLVCAGKGCLPRSIAATLLCRMRGQWPTWAVGARTAPFLAHAWIEAEGRIVDEGEHISTYRRLITVEPRGAHVAS